MHQGLRQVSLAQSHLLRQYSLTANSEPKWLLSGSGVVGPGSMLNGHLV